MDSTAMISPQSLLSELAVAQAGASRVFHRHGLDFCCHGRVSLSAACAKRELDLEAVMAELELERKQPDNSFERWDREPLPALIEHLLKHFHEAHRAELPRLVEMAAKVERVHADKGSVPRGLAEHLQLMQTALEEHMQKEEQVLFPMIQAGRGRGASMPVQVMEEEHNDHGRNLARLRELAQDYVAPAEACGTWRALYLGLDQLEQDLMQHIHLENNVLFPRALRG